MYQICVNCVMDTTDPSIQFNKDGICDNCTQYKERSVPYIKNNLSKSFLPIRDKILASSRGNRYNCILGLSGGVDSSFMLHYAVNELGLNPLVFHVDAGWNSHTSSQNINNLVSHLGLELFTYVVDWEEIKQFQLAFLRSGLPQLDIPQDLAFLGALYKYAVKYNIKYILNGGNVATEGVRNPLSLYYYGTDAKHISYIRKTFCESSLPTYPFTSILKHKVWLRYFKGIRSVKPLDYIDYNKQDAINLLQSKYGWIPYPQKHFESRFTKFYEGYWLPQRFKFDPRRVQLSSLIQSGQISRDDALSLLDIPPLTDAEIEEEKQYIADKLDISQEQLDIYLALPIKYYWDYPNSSSLFSLGAKVLQFFGLEASVKR